VTSLLFERYAEARRAEIDRVLASYLPAVSSPPEALHRAIHYALFTGGKRLRPILCLAACDAALGQRDHVLPFAAAIEMIHAYSLVHDDLPAMDNDAMRRGKPTTHKVFGEGMAILAGDALLTAAFTLMAEVGLRSTFFAKKILSITLELGTAAGSIGMVGGQAVDMLQEGKAQMDLAVLYEMHRQKTGLLIRASVRIGAILAGAKPKMLSALTQYGEAVGLAFQIADDLLDVTGESSETGKPTGADAAKAKWTYPRLMGLEAARKEAQRLSEWATATLKPFGPEADILREIAVYAVCRTR